MPSARKKDNRFLILLAVLAVLGIFTSIAQRWEMWIPATVLTVVAGATLIAGLIWLTR